MVALKMSAAAGAQCPIAQPGSAGRMMWDIVIVLALLYVGGRG